MFTRVIELTPCRSDDRRKCGEPLIPPGFLTLGPLSEGREIIFLDRSAAHPSYGVRLASPRVAQRPRVDANINHRLRALGNHHASVVAW
jgi:hypothetical protein